MALGLLTVALRILAPDFPIIFAIPAIVISAWIGGAGPGMATTAICVLAAYPLADAGFLHPPPLEGRLATLLVGAAAICIMSGQLHRARQLASQRARAAEQLLDETRRLGAQVEASRLALQTFVENIPTPVWIKDGHQRYTFVNDGALAEAGLTRAEVIGRHDRELLPASVAARTSDLDTRAIADRAPVRDEAVEVDGRYFLTVRFPLAMDDGSMGVAGAAIDATKLRRSEEALAVALQRSEERERLLQSVLDNVPEGITVAYGPEARLALVNRYGVGRAGAAIQALVGATAAERAAVLPVYGADASASLAPDDLPLTRACRGETVRNMEVTLRAGGEDIPLLCDAGPIIDETGKVVGGVLAWRDISERKQAETRLNEARRQLEMLLRNTPLAVIVWDRDLRITQWAGAGESLLGWTAEEMVGKSMTEAPLIHPEDVPLVHDVVRRLRSDRESHVVSWSRNRTRSGRIIQCEWYNSVLMDDDGHVRAILSLVLDVTERVRYEAVLREADERKDEFIATLSHELRNPLAPLRNCAQLLKGSERLEPGAAWAAGVIDRQVSHLARLLDDLLDVSRITQGAFALERKPVTMQSVLDAAQEQSRPLIEQGGHALSVDVPVHPLHLDGDFARLTQVFVNLLNNAATYSHRGGQIRLVATLEGEEVVVRVADRGIGIESAQLSRVFDIFSRGKDARGHGPGGLGIGLSLVKRIVEKHGGSVEARSAGAGQGSEFIVRLPAAPLHELPLDAVRAEPEEDGLRVLVVDDNRDSADSMAMLLQGQGHICRTAYDGRAAVLAYDELRPAVALLDIGLPDMTGYELARRLRERQAGDLRLVAMTGWGRVEDKEEASRAGFDAHLVKPVDLEELAAVLADGTRLS